jgi:flagellar basal body-associated protein FliL
MKARPPLRALLYLGIIAVAGVIVGSAATWWLMRREFIEQAVTRRVEVMRDFIGLDPVQEKEYEAITRQAVIESLKLPRGDEAARAALRQRTRESVRDMLNPEQRVKFLEFHARMQTGNP